MNITIEKKKIDTQVPPKGWTRDDGLRKTGLSAGKADIYYYSPSDCMSQMQQQNMESHDLQPSTSSTNMILSNTARHLIYQKPPSKKRIVIGNCAASIAITPSVSNFTGGIGSGGGSSSSTGGAGPSGTHPFRHQFDYSRGIRADASLVPPIRQTASIFKQPVTIYKIQESIVRADIKTGNQEKPKQLFWEKRLEGLRACDIDDEEFGPVELPKGLKPVGPHVNEGTLLQSIATSLHVSVQPVTGQTAPKQSLTTNPGAFLNPEQPLMHAINVSEDDIRRQEERVSLARRKLQDALRV